MQSGDETIAAAALRFVASFPGITTAISGMGEEWEIIQNVAALSGDPVSGRNELVRQSAGLNSQLCTGCGYCSGCPENISVVGYMQAYNMRLFPALEYMGRTLNFTDESQVKAYNVFRSLRQNSGIVPKSTENPCVKCGQCEEKCTQHLPIMSFLEDISHMAAKHEYSQTQICRRIEDAFAEVPPDRIGIYPTGVYTDAFCIFLKENFPDMKVKLFDKNPDLWGKESAGLIVMSPQEIPEQVDVLLIAHYLYQDAIYKELCSLEQKGVRVVKLHKDGDIPYFN
jgi:ferredoxin